MESLRGGSFVEIEVTTEDLVGTLAREHHLDAHALDYSCQEIHGS